MIQYRRPPTPDEVPGAGALNGEGIGTGADGIEARPLPPHVRVDGPVPMGDVIRSEFSNTLNSRIFFCVLGIAIGLGLGWWMHGKAKS